MSKDFMKIKNILNKILEALPLIVITLLIGLIVLASLYLLFVISFISVITFLYS